MALLCFCLPKLVVAQTKRVVSFSFNLAAGARTSAGVFAKDGTLIRTLWSGVNLPAGSHSRSWDGLNDDGQTTATDSYDIRVLSNNVNYTWEGVIGNSSYGISQNNNVQRAFLRMQSLAISGTNAYYGVGYAEGHPSQAKFVVGSPQARIEFFPKGETAQATLFTATDGTTVYWAGYDGYSNGNSWFVFGTKTSDNTEQVFPNGQSLRMTLGKTYASCLDVIPQADGTVTGLAVQKNGNYLFVSHKALHQIRVYNKTTGALAQTLAFNDAAGLAIDGQDRLWVINGVTVRKYAVQADGTLLDAGMALSGLERPMALAVSPDNGTVLVADGGGSQQLKAYSNVAGMPLWTFGQRGGYMTDPTVSNDKFYFSDISGTINDTFVAFQADGSFWVGDSGNYRAQHYSASRTFIDRIQYMQNNYSCYVDQNNPSRVFAQFLEFSVDYSKPLAANNGSWTLVKNWRATLPANYFEVLSINHTYITNIFRDVLTMPNGRVYGFLKRFSDNKLVVVELPASGPLRITNQTFDAQNRYTYHITPDGSLKQSANNYSGTTGTIDWESRPLNGFDASNNPIWGTPVNYASAPISTGEEPVTWYGGQGRTGETSASGVMITFDDGKVNGAMGAGYHLGGIKVNTNKWLWKTARATLVDYKGPYPSDGAYDVGNGVVYGGGGVSVYDRNIFWNYHGEFWKGSQTNKWQHVYDNGLLVGGFGKTGPEARQESVDGGPVPGMAGNVYYGTVVKGTDGNVYLYHAEEAGWSGIHRWKINGLNTIQEQIIPLQSLSTYAISTDPSDLGGVDLMQGLARKSVLQNGAYGWIRNPTTNFDNAYNDKWIAKMSVLAYDRFASPDLYVNFSKANSSYTVARDLGNNVGKTSWSLKGTMTFDGTNPNNGVSGVANTGGCYFDIIDINGKVIARIKQQVFFEQTNAPVKLYGNDKVIAQGQYFNASSLPVTASDPFEISMTNDIVTIKYRNFAPVSSTAYDKTASLRSPKYVRLFFWSNGINYERTIDIQSLRFYTDTTPLPTTASVMNGTKYYVQAKHSGKYLDVASQSRADGSSVIQTAYTSGTSQQWMLTAVDNDEYTISAVHSNKLLDIEGASTSDGATASQWTLSGQANQKFKLIDAGDGYFKVVNSNSTRCLEVQANSTADGALLQQSACGDGNNQKFLFTKVAAVDIKPKVVDSFGESSDVKVAIYPNPSVDFVTIDGAKGAAVTVFDALGRIKLITDCAVDSSTLSVSSLSTGEYILQLKKDNQVINKKLIVSRM
ncbi:RICIN domain-containing protein [Spirosoma sp.]|uniref:RICIN domain-containing protein n=1 Tax=Spirosoma sp. TaxID=1899569 RepID=UPI002601ABD7|nr:RICIN domain-containing protein [Spirosoma sp.]MCX6214526.1 RICIN domain-containing protein [Spirosoma sp.]